MSPAPADAPAVRRARADEWRAIGEVLGRSFWDDPVWNWVCPDRARLERHLGDGLARVVRPMCARGWVWTVGGPAGAGLRGAAVWAPPGRWRQPPREAAPALLPMARAIGLRHVRRAVRGLTRMEHGHPHDEHWYLEILGVHPDHQGQGLGTALMRPVLDRCDTEGVPAYLESSSPRSALLYRRHGFVETEEFPLGDGCPPTWRMWRDPR